MDSGLGGQGVVDVESGLGVPGGAVVESGRVAPGGAWGRPALAAASALALVVPALAWADIDSPARAPLAVAFALLVPGTPLALLLGGGSRAIGRVLILALVPALSLSALILLSVAQAHAAAWSPPAAASLLALAHALATPAAWARCGPAAGWTPRARPLRVSGGRIAGIAMLAAAAALWAHALATADLDAAGPAGILAVLPASYWCALALAAAATALALARRPGPDALLAGLGIAGLAVMITTFVGIVDGGSPVGTAYVHVGFIDWISQNGALREATDARFSWPGFFTAAAAVVGWAGLPDASALVIGFPVLAAALCAAPIYAIGIALFRDAATAWLGVALFVLGNWVQQDYFSPQAVALPLMLTVVAVLLSRMPGGPRVGLLAAARRTPAREPGTSARAELAIEGALLVIAAAIVVSHQLTPVALIVILAVFGALGASRSRTLWFGVAVIFAAWFAFGATDWWTGHLRVLIDGLGRVDRAVDAGVLARVAGDPVYRGMQAARIGWSALFAAAGLAGWLATRGGRLPMAVSATLVIAPAALVLGQPYGGEVVLRVYLYALPILAVLAAGGLARALRTRALRGRPRLAALGLAAVLAFGAGGVTTARGVNLAFERTPADVLQAARAVLWRTPTGNTVRPLATEGALRVARVGDLHQPPSVEGDGDAPTRLLAQDPDVVFLTSMRERYEQITGGAEAGWYERVVRRLEASGRYRVTERTARAIVLERVRADPPEQNLENE